MKISDVTNEFARNYCGVSDDDAYTVSHIQMCMDASKAFILGYTGLNAEEVDTHEDITIAYLILINEYHTNRDYTVDKAMKNPCVIQILAMHSNNYL